MSRAIYLSLMVLGLAVAGWAGVELYSFRAFPVLDHCQLEWTTGIEDNMRMYVIERSSDGSTFFTIGQVAPQGSFSQYTYSDDSPLDADMERTFYYRLRMISNDGTVQFSPVADVLLSFSPVQHTWGSIKAMFR